ncbi:transcriptional regulator [Haliea sp. AH-315-K21]|uniref:Transcriptional regulator n=1 Tax=SAR86 cluster bacterium TaxID=2030880 RepID=A0A2A5CBR1_9GAMM|nr:transcriptional regulator [Haliea sp. AH-315-K21]PCJ41242.1 MAG: transcriptional regulator [SAR86 cluster bacterium]
MPKAALGPLDEIIHPQARLAIMAYLNGIEGASFTTLRDALEVTDGNLSVHIRRLQDAGYIAVKKSFVDRKPKTFVTITKKGQKAFVDYLATLEKLLGTS